VKRICYFFIALLSLLTFVGCADHSPKVINTDVLVVGGGTAGTAAGIQSARLGAKTIVAEEFTWLGGMITAAGVAAFDGNHQMPSGIWAEFRQQIYQVYGGAKAVETGWVSNTLFEPHIGDSIFKSMAAREKNLQVLFQHRFLETIRKDSTIIGAKFLSKESNDTVIIYAQVVIDATELGDVIASAKVPYDLGMEADQLTGENVGVPATNDIVQDLTYVAILKDYGPAADCTIVKPAGYDPMEFDGCCRDFCSDTSKLASNVSKQQLIDYGKLPRGKYMINWPGKGNDIYLNVVELSHEEREKELQKAKDKTIRFLYFLQTQLGFKNLGLARDEFPTADDLPLIPYHRESRRMKGLVRFNANYVSRPFDQEWALYRTGVSVGDYPIDHHHRENLSAPQHLNFYPVPSYNIPLGALIPQGVEGLIAAEKSISVSNVVNGTTRLQPVVLLTGQAAGTLAALSVLQKKSIQEVSIRAVQETLLQQKAYILPYFDVKPDHPHFEAIQKLGATGILKGKGQPYKWANRTWFYPDSLVATKDLTEDIKELGRLSLMGQYLQYKDLTQLVALFRQGFENQLLKKGWTANDLQHPEPKIAEAWKALGLAPANENSAVKRGELAALLQHLIDPFHLLEVDHYGRLININDTQSLPTN
jgi:hypothetical protein